MHFQHFVLHLFFLVELRVTCSSQIEHSKSLEREEESFHTSYKDIQLSSISHGEETEPVQFDFKSEANIFVESESTCSDDGTKADSDCPDSSPIKRKKLTSNSETESYSAFAWLHAQIDDDKDGELDPRETGDFLAEELQAGSGAQQRHESFHSKHDSLISLQELWDNWKLTGVHNWTVGDVEEWLTYSVELPQYTSIFTKFRIDGRSLPRLCMSSSNNSSNYSLFQKLGIVNKTHQRKIAVKAMDVVLFGLPKKNTLLKDIVLIIGLMTSSIACWYLLYQYTISQKQLKKVLKDLNSLQQAEESLNQTQKQLENQDQDDLRKPTEHRFSAAYSNGELLKRSDSSNSEQELMSKLAEKDEENLGLKAEIEKLQAMLRQQSLERLSSVSSSGFELPPLLIEWLQVTHEVEMKHFLARKKNAEQQLEIAKQHGEKLTKKRNTFLGALQVAHGTGLSGIDNEILRARTALTEVTNDLHERTNRWQAIETLTGRSITRNSGVKELKKYISNYQSIIKSVNSGVGFGSVINQRAGIGYGQVVPSMVTPPFSSAQSSTVVSRSASQPNFVLRNFQKPAKSATLGSGTEDISSLPESDSTTINSIDPKSRLLIAQNDNLIQPVPIAQRQQVSKSQNPQNGTERSVLRSPRSNSLYSDVINATARNGQNILSSANEKRQSDSSGILTNNGGISIDCTPVVVNKMPNSKSTVSFAAENESTLNGGDCSESEGSSRMFNSPKFTGFAGGDQTTDESASLCSISAMSAVSTDDIMSSSTHKSSPQLPTTANTTPTAINNKQNRAIANSNTSKKAAKKGNRVLKHSNTFDGNLTEDNEVSKKSGKKSFLKRLIRSNSHKSKSYNSSLGKSSSKDLNLTSGSMELSSNNSSLRRTLTSDNGQ